MELLDSYLKAVRRYLPRRQRNDIIAELSEDLRAQLEARQREVGRPLTDAEQMEVFKRQGDPMAVALRYRQNGPSLRIGWELIGPEIFPAYLILLSVNLTITIAVVLIFQLIAHAPVTVHIFLLPLLAQVVCVTLVFIVLNFLKDIFARKVSGAWMWPPAELAHMMPLPRWYSASGLVACGIFTLWWLAIPHFPNLLLGSAAPELKFTPEWHRFYVPILLVILVGVGQRAVNVIRPDWNWLLPMARFVADSAGAGVMFFFRTHVLVVAADGASASQQHKAESVNGWLVWGLFGHWLWLYLGITSLVYGWYCLPYLRRMIRHQRGEASNAPEINGVVWKRES